MFLDHTQRRTTVGTTPLDELITRPEESYRLCENGELIMPANSRWDLIQRLKG